MPKLKVSPTEQQDRCIRAKINEGLEMQGLTIQILSNITGIPLSTLYGRIREPSKFTFGEMRVVGKALKFTPKIWEEIANHGL
ncbi:MAG: hypothetical protein FWE25_08385 [Lachnospiraceae bacterium]|nr:hypothetical protein [Lachnospiraceae bacterium]